MITPEMRLLLNPRTMIRFANTPSTAVRGRWFTPLSHYVTAEGLLADPEEIRTKLALFRTPRFVAIGGVLREGVEVIFSRSTGEKDGGPPNTIGGASRVWILGGQCVTPFAPWEIGEFAKLMSIVRMVRRKADADAVAPQGDHELQTAQ